MYPCHELCVSVRDACSPIMLAYGFSWPEMFDCNRFPQEEQQEMCINMDTSTDNTTGVCHLHIALNRVPKVFILSVQCLVCIIFSKYL